MCTIGFNKNDFLSLCDVGLCVTTICVYNRNSVSVGCIFNNVTVNIFSFGCGGNYWSSYINVFKLIQDYRKKVNPKVNVFSIQTAGYNNVVIPEYAYRTNIMYGWTGNEAVFANAMIDQWNEIENRN